MNCPVCDAQLRVVTKYGVEVDICPDCKGVWLDRGELDKILQMGAEAGPERREEYPESRSHGKHEDDRDSYHEGHGHEDRGRDSHGQHGRRRESWLGQLTDLFGGGD